VAAFTAEPSSGSVPPKGQQQIDLTLRTSRLGRIQLPVHVRTLGSRAKPLQIVLNARSLGPRLEFAPPQPPVVAALVTGQRQPSGVSRASRAQSGLAGGGALSKHGSGVSAEAGAEGGSNGEGAAVITAEGAAAGGASAEPLKAVPSTKSAGLRAAEPAAATGQAAAGGSRRSRAGGPASPAPSASTATNNTRARARSSTAREANNLGEAAAATAAASPWQQTASVGFDKVPVLVPHTKEVRVRNPTVIAAQMKLFIEGTNSVFEVRGGGVE